MALDKELEVWYENQFDMLASAGWKELVEQLKELKSNYSDIEALNSEKDLWFRRGQLDILNWLLMWEESVNEQYKELTE